MKVIVNSEKEASDICNIITRTMIEIDTKPSIHPIKSYEIMSALAHIRDSVEVNLELGGKR